MEINKAYAGFLSHTGYAHGGNGFEAMRFLIGRFRDLELPDPGNPGHGLDLSAIAAAYAREYKTYKGEAAEIEDHTNRGRNMDTRTPASRCRFAS